MALTGLTQAERTLFRGGVSSAAEGEATIIAWRGHVDVTTLPSVVHVLAGAIVDHTGPVVIDLAQADYVHAACVREVGLAARALARADRRITVRSPSRVALMLLASFGLSTLVEPAAELTQ